MKLFPNGVFIENNKEWRFGPDKDINHYGAEKWAHSLNTGNENGWRLPTVEELRGLYRLGKYNLDRALVKSEYGYQWVWYPWVWSSELLEYGNFKARDFFLYNGEDHQFPRDNPYGHRVIAVRDRNRIEMQ